VLTDQARQQILRKYADLFVLLKDLNDVCHEYLRTAKYHHGQGAQVSAVSYFMRGLMTFQSLISSQNTAALKTFAPFAGPCFKPVSGSPQSQQILPSSIESWLAPSTWIERG
jgi:hypothetical protein